MSSELLQGRARPVARSGPRWESGSRPVRALRADGVQRLPYVNHDARREELNRFARRWATVLATPCAGHAAFVVVAAPNVPVKPMTSFVNKATVEPANADHARLTWGVFITPAATPACAAPHVSRAWRSLSASTVALLTNNVIGFTGTFGAATTTNGGVTGARRRERGRPRRRRPGRLFAPSIVLTCAAFGAVAREALADRERHVVTTRP